MRIPRSTTALVAALTLAGSVGAASQAQQASKATPATSQELLARLARAELLAGLTEVSGPGLIITLRHSPHKLKEADPDQLLIHDYDLSAVLNELRVAGAEAMAVTGAPNGAQPPVPERILVNSAVSGAEGGVQINGTRLLPPYRILAVGNSDAMRTVLFRPSGVVKRAALDTLRMIDLENAPALVIPAARKASEPQFVRVQVPVNPAGAPVPVSPSAGSPVVEIPRNPLPGTATPPVKPLQPAPTPAAPPAPSTSAPGGGTGTPAPNRIVAVVPRRRVTAPVERLAIPPVAPVTPRSPVAKAETPAAKPEPAAAKPEPLAPRPAPAEPRSPRVAGKPAPSSSSASADSINLGLFGGKGLAKYHAAGCRFGERIERLQRVSFTTADAARQAGRVPCSICLSVPGSQSASR